MEFLPDKERYSLDDFEAFLAISLLIMNLNKIVSESELTYCISKHVSTILTKLASWNCVGT